MCGKPFNTWRGPRVEHRDRCSSGKIEPIELYSTGRVFAMGQKRSIAARRPSSVKKNFPPAMRLRRYLSIPARYPPDLLRLCGTPSVLWCGRRAAGHLRRNPLNVAAADESRHKGVGGEAAANRQDPHHEVEDGMVRPQMEKERWQRKSLDSSNCRCPPAPPTHRPRSGRRWVSAG